MHSPLQLGCPVYILQGMQDQAVPYQHVLELMEYLPMENSLLTLIKDADHRLSRPQDLQKLQQILLLCLNKLL